MEIGIIRDVSKITLSYGALIIDDLDFFVIRFIGYYTYV
jgi:hypothetical protein